MMYHIHTYNLEYHLLMEIYIYIYGQNKNSTYKQKNYTIKNTQKFIKNIISSGKREGFTGSTQKITSSEYYYVKVVTWCSGNYIHCCMGNFSSIPRPGKFFDDFSSLFSGRQQQTTVNIMPVKNLLPSLFRNSIKLYVLQLYICA